MPRRRHRGSGNSGHSGAANVIDGDGDGQAERPERIAVFERTKMCKFHILGVCTKGNSCRFAHDRHELQTLPDLQRTKLCKTLISTGECTNPACRYAHNKEELRSVPGMPNNMPQVPGALHQETPPRDALMPTPDPSMPNTALHQAAFDSAMQAAILQVGQAAQAHAVEAARLQALAAQLQAGGIGPNVVAGNVPFYSGAAFPGAALDPEAFVEQFGAPDPATHDLLLGLGESSAAAGLSAWRSEQSSMAPADVNMTVAAQVASEAEEGSGDGWADAMSRVLGDEPVQIRPETLRSLSSSSLVLLAGGTDDDSFPGTPEGATPQEALMKRQGWLRKVSEESTQGPEKYSQDTPLSEDEPEDNMANPAEAVVEADALPTLRNTMDPTAEPRTSPSPAVQVKANSDADPQMTEGTTEGDHHMQDGAPYGDDLAPGTDADEDDVGRRSVRASLAETFSASGITVKNTFLDFEPQEARTALRSVQTAAGRLDLMWQE